MENSELLHVEDDDAASFIFRAALDEARIPATLFRVTSAETAIAFLRRAHPYERAKTPRLIVLDLRLPQRDGWRLLSKLQNDAEL